jgi:hypothetical protein
MLVPQAAADPVCERFLTHLEVKEVPDPSVQIHSSGDLDGLTNGGAIGPEICDAEVQLPLDMMRTEATT